jgi:hypothetical protein
MEHQRIILDYSPYYVILCAALAAGIAYLLYNTKHPWSKAWNHILFVARFLLAFFLLFLLLGPVVRQISNYFEKPVFVILHDDSNSVGSTTDSVQLLRMHDELDNTVSLLEDKGFEVKRINLRGNEIERPDYSADASDLNAGLREITQRYEGRNISGVIFPTDGIYTAGLSPLYGNYNFPVYSIGLGDTTERTDLSIRNISYNRIAYQGNKYPVRVEVQVRNIKNENVLATLSSKGRILQRQTLKTGDDNLITFDFLPSADEQGIQKLDIQIEEKAGESNFRNNRASVFVEVVEGRKKILVVASSPHPDIKTLREVVEQNANYEFLLHIPGLREDDLKKTTPDKIDLVIFHQAPDIRGRTLSLFQQFIQSKASLLFVIGQQTDLRTIGQNDLPLRFDFPPREYDQVTPVVNNGFSSFTVSPEATSVFQDYPPVSVHFGKMRIPSTAMPLLYQKVGSVATDRPLLAVENISGRKIGLMLGEGLWRWRLNEFDRTERTSGFDELFGKLVQFLSTTDDKRKFKSYPVKQDFSDTEAVVFESQVYDDIFEPVYGNKIDIEITAESGEKRNYSYVTSPGNIRYQIGGLKEGVYKYRSRTNVNNTMEEVRGEFAVVAKQAELQNLTADFDLLRKLSVNTGGKFYTSEQLSMLNHDLTNKESRNIIHSEESYDSLVNLTWIFWLALAFISLEWFSRKFFGSY